MPRICCQDGSKVCYHGATEINLLPCWNKWKRTSQSWTNDLEHEAISTLTCITCQEL